VRILIAEDDSTSRFLLEATLKKWDHEVIAATDGPEAWEILQSDDAPQLAVLDWMMPTMNGIEVCRQARTRPELQQLYIIMLTTKNAEEDIVAGLHAGANDYVTKPFKRRELQARILVGERVVNLQSELSARVKQLEESIAREKQLQGLLPICSYCKRIRNDGNYWQQVERYIEEYADVAFSHSICPDCYRDKVEPELEEFKAQMEKGEGLLEDDLNESI
jgi:phosphoserine phosphatase RsbU/P